MGKTYIVSGIIKGQIYEDKFYAVSLKQAWYYFGKKYGFAIRDFKHLNQDRGIAS